MKGVGDGMLIHLPLIPGETYEDSTLAFTTLTDQLHRMMLAEGHEVRTYTVDAERPDWDDQAGWDRVTVEQAKQIKATDGGLLCVPTGYSQHRLMDVPLPTVEPFVGYTGTCCDWRVFPSQAWYHAILGHQQGAYESNGTWGDIVIPHPIDPDRHTLGAGEGGYLLFVGRMVERKGIEVAIRVAQEVGLPLIAAGAGDFRPAGAEYIGTVTRAERNELMGDAIALLAPTIYVEPFGLVVTEAQACGTPAITTDWGAFTETTDFRALTLEGFVEQVYRARRANRQEIRDRALERWAMPNIAPRYTRFLKRVAAA